MTTRERSQFRGSWLLPSEVGISGEGSDRVIWWKAGDEQVTGFEFEGPRGASARLLDDFLGIEDDEQVVSFGLNWGVPSVLEILKVSEALEALRTRRVFADPSPLRPSGVRPVSELMKVNRQLGAALAVIGHQQRRRDPPEELWSIALFDALRPDLPMTEELRGRRSEALGALLALWQYRAGVWSVPKETYFGEMAPTYVVDSVDAALIAIAMSSIYAHRPTVECAICGRLFVQERRNDHRARVWSDYCHRHERQERWRVRQASLREERRKGRGDGTPSE